MGWGRVVVGCVLSVISLTVLSLHVALCVHYPSPLFAVTLLLNPSLWMVVGGAGVGVAMAVTYRERQRKVRAAVCSCCHARYGATSDTKCSGARPRGPNRAVYAYNGTSHKMFASYGAITEQRRHHPPSLQPAIHTPVQQPTVHTPILPPSTYTHTLTSTAPTVPPTIHTQSPTAKEKQGEVDTTGEVAEKQEGGSGEQRKKGNERDQQPKDNDAGTTQPSNSSSSSVSTASTSQSCSCGAGLRTRQTGWRPRSESGAGRRPLHTATVRSFGGHKRLVMPCRNRPPGHVPVHLFAASTASAPGNAAPKDTNLPPNSEEEQHSAADSGSPPSLSHNPDPPSPPVCASPSQDPDVASLSSECGLLAGEEGTKPRGRDMLMSPLWGALRGNRKEQEGVEQEQDTAQNSEQQQEPGRTRPLSTLLAGTRRVLGRPRWPRAPQGRQDQRTSQNSRSPSRELLASPRKRRAPGSVWGMSLWRQQATSTAAQHVHKDNASHSQASPPLAECPATTPTPTGPPVRPRDTRQRRQRHGKIRQRPASDSVLLLSDDATEE